MTDREVQKNSETDRIKLSVSGVTKQFTLKKGQTIDAVSDLSFDVSENELCLILGPSGCGKSTLLRMIAGLDEPTTGSIAIEGLEIDGPGRDRGMIFQDYTSFDWLSVQKNVEYGMRLNGVSRTERRERADYYVELVGLTDFKHAFPAQLSGGMKQRVAIARTLANDPAILLMDEPFGALDAETRWQMQELMIRVIENSKKTVLMVTHDIEEAIFLADRILFLTRRPAQVREILPMDFKGGVRFSDKEEVCRMDGYRKMEELIMHMMRQESSAFSSA